MAKFDKRGQPIGNLEQLDPRQLVLDEKFQGRQTDLINSRTAKASYKLQRQQQRDIVLADLRAGKRVKHTIHAFELSGQLFVVDGFHRTEACMTYLRETKGAELKVPVKVYRGYSESVAFFFSLTANTGHGTALSHSERMQNQFKREVINQHYEYDTVPGKRELAPRYSCKETQGLHIQRALKACLGEGTPSLDEWATDLDGSIEKLGILLQTKYPSLRDEDFDKDGFPIIRRLSDATVYKGHDYDCKDDNVEAYEKKMALRLSLQLGDLIAKEGGERFRAALGLLDRKALGFSIKREWDEGEVLLKYPTKGDDLF